MHWKKKTPCKEYNHPPLFYLQGWSYWAGIQFRIWCRGFPCRKVFCKKAYLLLPLLLHNLNSKIYNKRHCIFCLLKWLRVQIKTVPMQGAALQPPLQSPSWTINCSKNLQIIQLQSLSYRISPFFGFLYLYDKWLSSSGLDSPLRKSTAFGTLYKQ